MEQRIVKFIKKHHVLTLATSSDNMPYCANAFYAYDAPSNRIIFTSDMSTLHAKQMQANPNVAVSIVWETKLVGKVQGVQILGIAHRATDEDKSCYIKRFPYAAVAELTLWAIEPQMIKLTDNTLGFGKKLIWNAK